MTSPILLVDDEPSMRFLERLTFEEHGVLCEEASSGAEALRRCEEEGPFTAVVLDHLMPDLTGIEVAEQLRTRGDQVPIVLYTAYAHHDVEARSNELGIQIVDKSDPERMVAAVLRLTQEPGAPTT